MDDTNVVAPELESVELETTSPSTSEIETDLEQVSDEEADGSEAVKTPEKSEGTPKADEPKTDKARNRFQELANRNKELEEKVAKYEAKPELETKVNTNQKWLDEFEKNPFIPEYNAYAKQIPDYVAYANRLEIENLKTRSSIEKIKYDSDTKYNQTVEIANKTPILNPESEEYSKDYRDTYEEFIYTKGFSPKEAGEMVNKLYRAALSKGQELGSTDSLMKKNISSTGSTSQGSKPKSFNDLSASEMRARLEKEGKVLPEY